MSDGHPILPDQFTDIIEKVKHVKNLTLGYMFIQILSFVEMLGNQPPPLLNVKSLILESYVTRYDLPGILRLLEGSPHLESLHIRMGPVKPVLILGRRNNDPDDQYKGDLLKWQNRNIECLSQQLKVVKITDLSERCASSTDQSFLKGEKIYDSDLAKFLVKKTKGLQKVTILPKGKICKRCLTKCQMDHILS